MDAAYGPHDATGYDDALGGLYVQVLRPLCWSGLLVEHRAPGTISFGSRSFIKTPLWRAALQLDTDKYVHTATRHKWHRQREQLTKPHWKSSRVLWNVSHIITMRAASAYCA